LLKKAGADDYQHAIMKLLHNIVRGQGTKIASKHRMDKLSWYFKTVWFATAVVVLVLSSPIRMFI
jgi:hypothetical protein